MGVECIRSAPPGGIHMRISPIFAVFTVMAAVMTAAGGDAFSPRDMDGLALWLDASDSNSVIIADGRVSLWRDLSTNRCDAVQPVRDLRPGYLPGGKDGGPALRFFALGVMLQTDCVPAYSNNPRTIVIAMPSVNEAPGNINHVLHYGSPHIREAYGLTSRGVSRNVWGNHYWADGFDTGISSGDGGGYIVVGSYSGGVDRINVNGGTAVTHRVELNTAAGIHGKYGIGLGARIDPYFGRPAEPGRFDCAEVLAFSRALDAGERQKLEGYLAHKWGMADKLPDGHPYKASGPASGR